VRIVLPFRTDASIYGKIEQSMKMEQRN